MAKKSRRIRREEGMREVTAPRVPNSMPTATQTGVARPVTPTPGRQTTRPGRVTETSSRLSQADLNRDFAHVRQDLRKIAILATSLFAILFALAFILPQILG